jgi:GNAT superfamily N-acetyltransferase
MKLSLVIASPDDAAAITILRNEAAHDLTIRYGEGHWSYLATERGIANGMMGNSKMLIAKLDNRIAGVLRLTTKKPWAIDPAYFTPVPQPLYLVDMSIHPSLQLKGIGTFMLHEVQSFAKDWPAQSIRLDAYDAAAGAGEFYKKCGYTEMGRVVYRKVGLVYFERLV